MSTRVVSPGNGWRWLMQAINLGRSNPRAVLGAVALLLVIALVPSIIQVCLQAIFKLGPAASMALSGVFMLLSIVIFPPAIGGLLRVIHAAESGKPTRAMAVFDAFQERNGRNQLIAFGAVMTAIYLGVFGFIIGVFGKNLITWYMQLVAAAQAGSSQTPQIMANVPAELGSVVALGSLFGLFLSGIYAIGFGQVAIGRHGVKEALADGFSGTLRNLLPLLVLALLSIVLMIALALVVGIIGGIVAMVGGLIHPLLGVLLVLPIYLGMMLVMYMVIFGVMYFMWGDICEDTLLSLTDDDSHIEI